MKKSFLFTFSIIFTVLIISCGGGGGGSSDNDELNDDLDGLETVNDIVLDSGQGFSYAISTTDKVIIIGITPDGEQRNSITIPSYIENKEVIAIGKSAFLGTGSILKTIILPDTIVDIQKYAFQNCYGLTSINIPKNILRIGYSAFSGCSNWNSELILPNSLKIIGKNAFYDCSKLNGTLLIPPNIKVIESYSFRDCSSFVGTMIIPKSVERIMAGAFMFCSGLTGVRVENNVPPSVGNDIFGGCTALTAIYVPSSVVGVYKAAPGWSNYSGIIVGY